MKEDVYSKQNIILLRIVLDIFPLNFSFVFPFGSVQSWTSVSIELFSTCSKIFFLHIIKKKMLNVTSFITFFRKQFTANYNKKRNK